MRYCLRLVQPRVYNISDSKLQLLLQRGPVLRIRTLVSLRPCPVHDSRQIQVFSERVVQGRCFDSDSRNFALPTPLADLSTSDEQTRFGGIGIELNLERSLCIILVYGKMRLMVWCHHSSEAYWRPNELHVKNDKIIA